MSAPEEKKCGRKAQGDETKQKLITIGTRMFGLNGYNGVSLRALSKESGTNLATVSYHFGGKQGLYEAILYSILERKEKIFPSEACVLEHIAMLESGEINDFELISWFIKTFVKGLIVDPETIWAVIIVSRELANPGEFYPVLEEKFFRPSFRNINLMLEAILGDDISKMEKVVIGEAIIGMSLKFVHKKEFLFRLGEDCYTPELIDEVTDILGRRAACFVGCKECC
jgi:AcrR family transcriptional regulator